jgi:hypothetical protein
MSAKPGIPARQLVTDMWAKVDEQIERLARIIRRIPPASSDWKPELLNDAFPNPRSLGDLTRHLISCLGGFLAVLHAAYPDQLSALLAMKEKRVSRECPPDEAIQCIEEYRFYIRAGFDALNDADLGRMLPTVFVPSGESVLTLLLGNLEHLVNHKHELFYYVKLRGIHLTSADLYRFRGKAGDQS